MKEEHSNTTVSLLEKVLHISLFTYLFLLIFPHTTTPREIVFWTAFLCWAMLRFKKSEPFIALNPVITSLSLFMIIALISSSIGMGPLENLKRFKGELLIPFILFLIASTEFSNIEKIKRLISAPLIGFVIYTVLALIESTNYGLQYFWDKTHREQYVWLTSYSQMSAVIFPITLGLILLITNRWFKYFLIFFAILEFAILTAYRGFTVFLASVSMLLLWIIFARPKKYRLWMIAFISLLIFISGGLLYTLKDNPAILEYRIKLEKIINISGEFKMEGGFSNRMPPWKAAVDVIKEKPLLGYGWGMKKFTKLVEQEKFLKQWRINNPSVYDFYTTFKDKFFPPHNVFLEITIQSGLTGISAFLIFMGLYIFYLVTAATTVSSDTDYNLFTILIGGILLSFLITGLMSNDLGSMNGKVLFSVLGAGTGFINRKGLYKCRCSNKNIA